MKRAFHGLMLDLHLYLGLFSTPFVLLFAGSVFFLVHAWLPRLGSESTGTRVVSGLNLPADVRTLSGRPLIEALKPVLRKEGLEGEIGFIRRPSSEELVVPLTIPGREMTVDLKLGTGDATIVTRELGLAGAMATLHRSPGEHAPAIRMNWIYMAAWRWLADTTAYLVLLISMTGVYLWYVLRAERRVGVVLMVAGGLSLVGMAYALSR
jgi:hypothetical protein